MVIVRNTHIEINHHHLISSHQKPNTETTEIMTICFSLFLPIPPHNLNPQQTPNHLTRRIRIPTQVTLIRDLRIKERCYRNDDIRCAEKCTFKVVGSPIQDEEVNDEGRDEE
jgi:hypothetical protein